jgi:ketosteroid isomerase-like protein
MDNVVQNETARGFIAALRTLEQDHDCEPMIELFTGDAQLSRLDRPGAQGDARQFWTEYRRSFGEIGTTFTHATEGGAGVALEWTSQGSTSDGRGVDYAGVTILDLDGQQVTGLRTYYDSAAFLTGPARGGPAGGEQVEAGQAEAGQVEAGHTAADSGFEPLPDREAAQGDR